MIEGKNGDVSGFANGQPTVFAEYARRASGKEFNHAHERDAAGVDELLEGETERGLRTQNAEGRFVELDVLERRLVRGMVRGDGIDGAVGQAFEKRLAVFTRTERRIHLEARIIGDVFVDESEVVRRNFTRDG